MNNYNALYIKALSKVLPHISFSFIISPFHTEIPENTRVMCSGICSRIVRFAAFTLPVIFRNLCVHSHTTRKDPVKTRDLSCDVYNAPLTISLNWRMISASARIVRSSLIAASFQFTYFSSCERWSAFKTLRHWSGFCSHSARSGTEPGNVTRSPTRDQSRN